MFCWLEFVDGTDTDVLLRRALAEGVAFVPGSAFSVTRPRTEAARCCFATLGEPELRDAVRRLATAWRATAAPGRPA
jgi:2-aminoadipate transaminase